MARKLKNMENEKHALDDLKNDEKNKKREKEKKPRPAPMPYSGKVIRGKAPPPKDSGPYGPEKSSKKCRRIKESPL